MDPDGWAWDLPTSLAAFGVDELRVANWQRTKNGADGKSPPEPIPQPAIARAREARAAGFRRAHDDWQRWKAERYRSAEQ